jgi:putative tricarboxylic transport membrane protein
MGEEFFRQVLAGFNAICTIEAFLFILGGTAFGIVFGAIPGFTSSMGVVILLPVTFYISPLNALVFLCAIYVSAIYGGLLTAILLNTPGLPESSVTTFDGYPMTQMGKASEAIGIGIGASVIGGLFSYFVLLFAMAPVAVIALRFGPTEMFLIAVMGITVIASLRGESLAKGLLAGAFGLLIGTMGIAPTGEWRATFGNIYLADGVPIVPPIIGLFAMSELLFLVEREFVVPDQKPERRSLRKIISGMRQVFRYPGNIIRSAFIGLIVGAIPAAGATLAAFTSYNEAKRFSRNPEKFGTGYPGGIIAAETANNASTGGALLTTLIIGVPGSTTTAIILGAMIMHGLQPGPQLIKVQSVLVYGLIVSLFLSQVIMVFMGLSAGYSISGILSLPSRILVPIVSIFCMIGSFAIRNSMFDIYLMFAFGLIGYLMRKTGFPPVALVLGIVLGPIADSELIRSFMRYGNDFYLYFFNRPISLALVIIIVIGLVGPISYLHIRHKQQKKIDGDTNSEGSL